ncbi:serine hydrolase [Pandoraea pneumonica]|uniref:serine hydrolase n=1 Tax=Pandoraea pneumonica TaxID=2508299 RepID=UPI003CF9FA43
MTSFRPTRRQALQLAAVSLAPPALLASATNATAAGRADLDAAVRRFGALAPQTTGCLVLADIPTGGWKAAYEPDRALFVGSAVKTYILGQFLLDVESGRNQLKATQLCDVNDSVRTPGSPVLIGLTGQTQYRTALEAMISHSDNLGTDISLAAVGPDRVRELVRRQGLTTARIPDSTRKLFSYLAGAEPGTDLGWAGMQKLERNEDLGLKPRTDVINDHETMTSSATDLVRWYRQVLRGKLFKQPSSLVEFKRISAMADAIWMAVPDGLLAYGKGGSLDWENFHALCFAGEMLVGKTPVTFCFTSNWLDGKTSVERTGEFITAASDVLKAAAKAVG